MYSVDNQLKIEDFIFSYGNLDKENRQVKLAAIIPWAKFEKTYAKQFINNGRPSKPFRIVYRQTARREFLRVSKAKKKNYKKIRKAIRKQLNFIARDIRSIESFFKSGKSLTKSELSEYKIILELYYQQKYMFDNKKHTVENRIVSINQPYIRPIVRGKTKAPTEFGAKVEISVINGYVRMEKLSWDAYNECESLIPIIEAYKARTGLYPERILVDKIYKNRRNLNYCKKHNISITGPALVRSKKNKSKEERKQEYIDGYERNQVKGKFETRKVRYGLARVFTHSKETAQCVINMAFFVMNLNERLRVILCYFFSFRILK